MLIHDDNHSDQSAASLVVSQHIDENDHAAATAEWDEAYEMPVVRGAVSPAGATPS